MNTTEKTVLDAILVTEEGGKAVHSFCTYADGKKAYDHIQATSGCGGSLIHINSGFCAELVMKTSPNIQSRVEEAKLRLQNRIRLREALDKQGVPSDQKLRAAIHAAFIDYSSGQVELALRN